MSDDGDDLGGGVDLWSDIRADDTADLDDLLADLVDAPTADASTEDEPPADDLAEVPDDDPAPDDDPPEPLVLGAAPRTPGSRIGRLAAKLPHRSPPQDEVSEGEGVVVLHDKMRDRRIKVRREEGHRRLKRLAWVLAGLAIIVDGAALAHTSLFAVHDIEVVGATHTNPATIKWASGIHDGDALLTLDANGAARSIEKLSWVDDVKVEKHWPDTVRLVVSERTPAALIQTRTQSALGVVDAGGRILQIGGAVPPGLVTVTDVPLPFEEGGRIPRQARRALRLAVAAAKRIPGAVTSVSPGLDATLSVGGRAAFGSLDELDEKLLSVATVLARVDLSCLDVLDVKVPGSPLVSRGHC